MLAWCLGGAAIAAAGWAPGHEPLLLCLVPTFWALAPTCGRAFAFVLGYMLSTTDASLLGSVRFATSMPELALYELGWVAACGLVAGAWALAHVPFRWSTPLGAASGLLLQCGLLLPPLWLLGSCSPVIGWGYVLGGTGLSGLLGGVAASIGLGSWLRRRPSRDPIVILGAAVAAAFLQSFREDPDLQFHSDVYGVHVRWPGPGRQGWEEVVDRLQKVGNMVRAARQADAGLRTIVFPEGTFGDLMGRMDAVFDIEVVAAATRSGLQVVVGADESTGARRRVGVLIVDPDGSIHRRFARQPMPVTLWRPWSGASYAADWSLDPTFTLADGRVAYLSVCYEDLVPGMFVAAMERAKHRPQIVVSVANDWWMPSDHAVMRQARAVEGMAKLYGVPIVRAVNFSSPEAGGSGPTTSLER